MKMTLKWQALFILSILLVPLPVTGCSTRTYTNEEAGFSFRYSSQDTLYHGSRFLPSSDVTPLPSGVKNVLISVRSYSRIDSNDRVDMILGILEANARDSRVTVRERGTIVIDGIEMEFVRYVYGAFGLSLGMYHGVYLTFHVHDGVMDLDFVTGRTDFISDSPVDRAYNMFLDSFKVLD